MFSQAVSSQEKEKDLQQLLLGMQPLVSMIGFGQHLDPRHLSLVRSWEVVAIPASIHRQLYRRLICGCGHQNQVS